MCHNGIHGCRPEALSRWLDDELWSVELEDVELEREGVLLARRGRLLQWIPGWNDDARRDFAGWCLQRARDFAAARPGEKVSAMLAYVEELLDAPALDTPMVAFCTAKIAAVVHPEEVQGERRRQSEWLVERLALS